MEHFKQCDFYAENLIKQNAKRCVQFLFLIDYTTSLNKVRHTKLIEQIDILDIFAKNIRII